MTAIRNILLPLGFLFVVLFQAQTSPIPTIEPLLQAHAHNDYEHERPLLDALAQGFTSVEADVHLIGKKLLVAHNARDIQADKTLQSLYLNPLRDIIRQNRGSVFPEGSGFTLFIDIKTKGEATYQAKEILTSFPHEKTLSGAVTVIISGNRPRQTMENQNIRYAAYDGRLTDLDTNANPNFIPIISDNWRRFFLHVRTGKDTSLPTTKGSLMIFLGWSCRRLTALVSLLHSRSRRTISGCCT